MDQEARHYRKMGNALWLFLYLVLNANRKNGFLARKIRTIAEDTGINKDTISRWLNILREKGYVSTQNTGRCLLIQIKKWKGLSEAGGRPYQKPYLYNTRSRNDPTPQEVPLPESLLHFCQNRQVLPGPNDITINKYILTNDIDRRLSPLKAPDTEGFPPQTKLALLARDMAYGLNDGKSLALYLSYVRKYPSFLLQKAFNAARAIPGNKIKKSRGALFNYLIQTYAKKTYNDPGDQPGNKISGDRPV